MHNLNQKIEFSFRDNALMNYYAMKNGRGHEVQAELENTAKKLQPAECTALECAYWLWTVGEHANQGGGRLIIDAYADLIATCIERIELLWNKPGAHWLREGEFGLFLTNIAIYYGALRSISNLFRSENAQKLCKDIRMMTFSTFMKENHFISKQGSDEVWDDIVAAAVPYGLVSAGDLAMLGSIACINEEHVRGDAAALFSCYYSESGQLARAKLFLDKASESNNRENKDHPVLYHLAASQLALKSSHILASQAHLDQQDIAVHFKHDPVGGECPYIFGSNERSPRLVTIDSPVTIRTFAQPFNPALQVSLEYTVDQGDLNRVLMQEGLSVEGEQYWQAALFPFTDFARVEYRFIAKGSEEGNEQASEWYPFDVLKWVNADRVVHIDASERQVSIDFAAPIQGGRTPALTVRSNDSGAVSCSFALKDNRAANQNLDAFICAHSSFKIGCVEVSINDSSAALFILDAKGQAVSSSSQTSGIPLLQMLIDRQGNVYKLHLNFELNDEEHIYGMGERFARMEFRGYEVDNYVYNQYKDQGFKTYIPIPLMLSTNGYGLFLQSSLYSVFRIATVRSDLLQIEADVQRERQSLSFCLFAGKPLEIISQFTALTGKPKLPPKWAFGPWMSSNNWDSEKEVDGQLALTQKHAIPSTVMVIEQWSDESTFYIFNDAQYDGKPGDSRFSYNEFSFPAWGRWPNPKKLVERIHANGIKVLLWQAPVMKFMDGIAHWQRDEDERVMIANDYSVRNKDGSPYRIPPYEWFRGSLVPDFTSPEASDWWLSKRQYLLEDIAIDGFKTDGGECIYGSDVLFHDGRSGAEMRNEYPNTYIQAFHNFTNAHVAGGGITFSRAGYTGAQKMPLHWAGDEKSTFAAFRSSIMAGLNCGISGIPFWGWDLGGFSGEIPTAELFVRSAQMAAFCPVMQYHAESKGEYNLDRTPWNIAERTGKPEVLEIYKTYADLRMNMLPYIYEQAKLSSISGHPLMGAMLLAYPDDTRCLELTLQYMFGQHLLVAPNTEEGASEVEFYLPEGSWLSFFDQEVLPGGRSITAAANITQIPVFIREDSVIPLNLDKTYKLASHVGNHIDHYNQLSLMIFLTKQITYSFSDDLGYTITMTAIKKDDRMAVAIELTGDSPVTLIFRAVGIAASVQLNGNALTRTTECAMSISECFVQRDNELLIPVNRGSSEIIIEIL